MGKDVFAKEIEKIMPGHRQVVQKQRDHLRAKYGKEGIQELDELADILNTVLKARTLEILG